MDHLNSSASDTCFYRVDLNKLSKIVKCSQTSDLVAVLKKDAVTSVGIVADHGYQHEFNVLPAAPLMDIPPNVRFAVVDSVHVTLGSTMMLTVLEMGLRTLFLAGISSVVILLCDQDRKTAELINHSAMAEKLVLHIVIVDGNYAEKECGEAILEARDFLDRDFLYFQSSDIYEPSIIYALANTPLEGVVASILVDHQANKKLEKPTKVQSTGNAVDSLGMEITAYNTYAAGLYLLSHGLLKILRARKSLEKSLRLTSVLSDLCSEHLVSCHTSDGAWMAVRNHLDIKSALEEFEVVLGGSTLMLREESVASGLVLGIPSLQHSITVSGQHSGMKKFTINHLTSPQKQKRNSDDDVRSYFSSPRYENLRKTLFKTQSLVGAAMKRGHHDFRLPWGIPLNRRRSVSERNIKRGRKCSYQSMRPFNEKNGPQYHTVVRQPHTRHSSPHSTPRFSSPARKTSQCSSSRSLRSKTLSVHAQDVDFLIGADASPYSSPASSSHRGKCFAFPFDFPAITQKEGSERAHSNSSTKNSTEFFADGEFNCFHNTDHLLSIPEIDAIDSVGHYQALLIQTDKEDFVLATPEYEEDSPSRPGLLCRPCRNSMHMPCEIEKLQLQAVVDHEHGKPQVQLIVTRKVPVLGWVILLVTLIASSSTGPLEARLDFPPLLLNFWRRTCSGAMFFPFAMKAFLKPTVRELFLETETLFPFGMALLGMTVCNTFFYTALMYLAIPLCSLFENSVPLVLVGVRLFTGQAISWMEGIGTITAMCGAAIVSADALKFEASSATGTASYIHGSVCAFLAAIGMAIYLTFAKQIRPTLDITLLNFAVCIVTPVASLVLEVLFYQSDFGPFPQLPTKSRIGVLFGYLFKPDLFFAQLGTSFIMDIIASQGALAVLCYFEALLVSVVLLTQPVVVILLDLVLGVSSFPSTMTLIGCTVVMLGCGFVVISSSGEHIEVIDASSLIDAENHSLEHKRCSRAGLRSSHSASSLRAGKLETTTTKKYFSEHNLCHLNK